MRRAYAFELELLADAAPVEVESLPEKEPAYWKLSLAELEQLARRTGQSMPSTTVGKRVVRQRSEAVRVLPLRRASGTCEGCHETAPFLDKVGRPFLEAHHLFRLTDGGPDLPENVVAICPNCHRRVHQGKDGAAWNEKLALIRGSGNGGDG
jgi:5-methylcytosine-specific restriction enzyme A